MLGQVPRQPFRYLITIRGRASRPHDRNYVTVQNLLIPPDIQQRRRIVNFQQALRIVALLPVYQAAAALAHLRQLFLRVAEGPLRKSGLRRCHGQLASLQFRKRCAENFLRRTEVPQQLSREPRTQPRRESQRQPRKGVVQVHSAATLLHSLIAVK
jgi:hypothetical protein